MAISKARRERIAAGICTMCGKVPAREGHRMCEACAEVQRNRMREIRKTYAALGRCACCGARFTPEKPYDWMYDWKPVTTCDRCRERDKKYNAKRREKRREQKREAGRHDT